jgi:hypothetical protein
MSAAQTVAAASGSAADASLQQLQRQQGDAASASAALSRRMRERNSAMARQLLAEGSRSRSRGAALRDDDATSTTGSHMSATTDVKQDATSGQSRGHEPLVNPAARSLTDMAGPGIGLPAGRRAAQASAHGQAGAAPGLLARIGRAAAPQMRGRSASRELAPAMAADGAPQLSEHSRPGSLQQHFSAELQRAQSHESSSSSSSSPPAPEQEVSLSFAPRTRPARRSSSRHHDAARSSVSGSPELPATSKWRIARSLSPVPIAGLPGTSLVPGSPEAEAVRRCAHGHRGAHDCLCSSHVFSIAPSALCLASLRG